MISMELGPLGGHQMHLGPPHSMSFSPSPEEMHHHHQQLQHLQHHEQHHDQHHDHHDHLHDHHDMQDQDDMEGSHQDSKRKRKFYFPKTGVDFINSLAPSALLFAPYTNFSEAFCGVKVPCRAQMISIGCETVYEIYP